MKKQFLFAALAVATLFSACSQEEELSKNEGATPVNFVIGGVGARTTTTDAFVASFEVDDEVGIFSTGLKNNQIANGQYKVANSNNIYSLQPVETTDFYFDNEADASFYAYYPYAESVTSNAVTLTVKADQSVTNEADNFNCNDLLVATQTVAAGAATADGVTLAFDHVMSFVELTFGTNLATIGVSEVAMTIASPTITYDFTSTETVKYAVSGAETSIKMYKKGDNKFWAIVPPQTIQGGKALFTITAENDRTYSYTVAADATEEFKSNAVRKIKLDVASPDEPETTTVFKIASISVNDWGTIDEEAEEKEVEEVVVPAIELISSTDFTNASLGTVVGGLTSMNTIGWAQVGPENNAMVTLGNGTLTIKAPSAVSSSWYNRAVICRTAPISKVTKFELKFTVKSDKAEGSSDLQLAVMMPEATNNTWFKLNSTTAANYCAVTKEAVEKIYTIDLTQSNPANAVYANGILLLFSPKSADDVTYTITNLTLVEVKE